MTLHGYRVAQNKDCEAQLHEIALAELFACMEDLRKKDFISIQINMQTSQSCTRKLAY